MPFESTTCQCGAGASGILKSSLSVNTCMPFSVAWVTVPVTELQEYSRTVTIELADGEQLTESAQTLLEKARREYARRDFSSAARTLDLCINRYPTFPQCHHMLGSTFAQLKRSEEARTRYVEFLRLAPDDPEAPAVRKIVEEYEKHLKEQPTGN